MTARKLVQLDGRTFIVKLASDGAPLAIVERKAHAAGRPWAALHDAPYWHRSHGVPVSGRRKRLGGPSIVRELLRKAGVDTRHFNDH